MAKGLKYFFEYASVDEVIRRIEIWVEGFTGDPEELDPGASPFVRSSNKTYNEEYMGGIVPTRFDISAVSSDTFNAAIFNTEVYGDIIFVQKDDTGRIMYTGILVPFVTQDIDAPNRIFITKLTFECGLSNLKNYEIDVEVGRIRIAESIAGFLSFIPNENRLPIDIIDNVTVLNPAESISVRYFDTFISKEHFGGKNIENIVVDLLQGIREIYMSDGKWVIRNIPEVNKSDSFIHHYDTEGAYISSEEYNRGSINATRLNGTFSAEFSHKSIIIEKDESKSIQRFGDVGEFDSFDGWDKYGLSVLWFSISNGRLFNNGTTWYDPTYYDPSFDDSTSYIQNEIGVPFYPWGYLFSETSGSESLSFEIKSDNGASIESLRFQIIAVQTDNNYAYFLTSEGAWWRQVSNINKTPIFEVPLSTHGESTINIDVPKPPYNNIPPSRTMTGQYGVFEGDNISSPASNVLYRIYIRVFLPKRFFGITGDPGFWRYSYIDYIRITGKNTGSFIYDGFKKTFGDKALNADRGNKITVPLMAGFPSYPNGTEVIYANELGGNYLSKYHPFSGGDSIDLAQFISKEYLDILSIRHKSWSGTVFNSLHFGDIISIDDQKFRIHDIKCDDWNNSTEVKLIVFNNSETTVEENDIEPNIDIRVAIDEMLKKRFLPTKHDLYNDKNIRVRSSRDGYREVFLTDAPIFNEIRLDYGIVSLLKEGNEVRTGLKWVDAALDVTDIIAPVEDGFLWKPESRYSVSALHDLLTQNRIFRWADEDGTVATREWVTNYITGLNPWKVGGNTLTSKGIFGSTSGAYDIGLVVNGVEAVTLKNGGKVGIGTMTPIAHTHVHANTAGETEVLRVSNVTTDRYFAISVNNTSNEILFKSSGKVYVKNQWQYDAVVNFTVSPTTIDAVANNEVPNLGQVLALVSAGFQVKTPVMTVATTNISLSGLSAVSGYTPSSGDRILVTGQTNPAENGVWIAAAGAWTRSPDEDTDVDIRGKGYLVLAGDKVNTQWVNNNQTAITVGTTPITYVQWSGQEQDPIFAAWRDASRDERTVWAAPSGGSGAASWRALIISDITGLQTALDGKVPVTRTINTGTGLIGGGDLTANRTISLDTAYTDGRYVTVGGNQSNIGGTKLWINAHTYSVSTSTPDGNVSYLFLRPTDYGTGKPYFSIFKNPVADSWTIGLWDGTSNNGTINISSQFFNKQGNTVWHNGNFPYSATTLTTGQLLRYNGTSWSNWSPTFLPSGSTNGIQAVGEAVDFNTLSKTSYYTQVNIGGTTNTPTGFSGGGLMSVMWSGNGGQIIMGRNPDSWFIRGSNGGTYSTWGTLATKEWIAGNYIQNQIASVQPNSNAWISGIFRVGGTGSSNGYKTQIDAGSTSGNGLWVNGIITQTSVASALVYANGSGTFVAGTSSHVIATLGYTPVPVTRTINTGTGLVGGNDLTSNLTLAFDITWGDARYLRAFTEVDPVFTEWRDASRTAKFVWAAPNAANGAAVWRQLVISDIVNLQTILDSKVPATRTVTINGNTQSLVTDISFTVDGSKWTTTGSDIYRNSKIIVNGTTFVPSVTAAITAWGSVVSASSNTNYTYIYSAGIAINHSSMITPAGMSYYPPEDTLNISHALGRIRIHTGGGSGNSFFEINDITKGNYTFLGSMPSGSTSSIGTGYWVRVNSGTDNGLALYVRGSVYATDKVTGRSDMRLKAGIGALEDPIALNRMIAGYTYYWKSDKTKSLRGGHLAQEVQNALPWAVSVDSSGYLGVEDRAILALHTSCINAISDKQDAAEKEIERLKKRVAELEQKLVA